MTLPATDTSSVDHQVIDAYTEALRRGDLDEPEVWLRSRSEDDSSGVSALRAVGLLFRHRDGLRAPGSTSGSVGATPEMNPSPRMNRPVMSAPSAVRTGRPGSLTDDREWLGSHQLEMLGFLDVGGGGMGVVALAWHTGMKREVILKLAREPHFEERFRREIEVHAKLGGHANIAVARTSLIYQDMSVLVVDYVAGPNLRRWVNRVAPLPWREACKCVRQAALGLGHAHAKGVVHRDVKSSNLVRSDRDGVVSVIDWGLALDRESPPQGDANLTVPGSLLGTPEYCAPEQAADATSATAASDLYGLGCSWYELITGRPPFQGDRQALARAHARAPVPPLPAELEVPEAVEHVLRKVLDKNPERRYRTAEDLIAALDEVLPRGGVPAPRGRPSKVWFVAAAALILVVAGWWYWPRTVTPAALDLVIELSDLGPNPERSGQLGTSTFAAREGDQVSLRAELSAPGYSYLISFRPDGQMELCLPTRDIDPPERTASPASPSDKVIDLNDGTGLQVFAVVTSRSALPAFRTWRAEQGPSPWKATKGEPGVVWRSDGRQVETLKAAENTIRGAGVTPRGTLGAVSALADWLKTRRGVDTFCLKAFAVSPARP